MRCTWIAIAVAMLVAGLALPTLAVSGRQKQPPAPAKKVVGKTTAKAKTPNKTPAKAPVVPIPTRTPTTYTPKPLPALPKTRSLVHELAIKPALKKVADDKAKTLVAEKAGDKKAKPPALRGKKRPAPALGKVTRAKTPTKLHPALLKTPAGAAI